MCVAFGRVLRQHAREFVPAAGILMFERLTHRGIGVFRRAEMMPSSANIFPVSAAMAFMASRVAASGVEPQPQPAAVTDRQRCGYRIPTCNAVYAPIECPTTWAFSIPSASITAITSSRAMFCE